LIHHFVIAEFNATLILASVQL